MRTSPKALVAAAVLAHLGLAHLSPAGAVPLTIDFENFTSTSIVTPVVSGGFTFSPASGNTAVLTNDGACAPLCAANGTATLVMGHSSLTLPSSQAPLTMSSTSATSFHLLGFDFAELIEGGAPENASSLRVTGLVVGGGTISELVTIDGVNDGPGGVDDFQASSLSAIWSSTLLTSVQFAGLRGSDSGFAFQLDNVRVDTSPGQVPEPGSLALMAFAMLGALGAGRLRQRG